MIKAEILDTSNTAKTKCVYNVLPTFNTDTDICRHTGTTSATLQKTGNVPKTLHRLQKIYTLLNIYTIMLNAMSTIPGKYKREFIASTILLRNLKRYNPKNMSLT